MRTLTQYKDFFSILNEDMALSAYRKNLISFNKDGILDKKIAPAELPFVKKNFPEIITAIKSIESDNKLKSIIGTGDKYINDSRYYTPETLYKIIQFYEGIKDLQTSDKMTNDNYAVYMVPDTDIVIFIPFTPAANRFLSHSVLTKPGQKVPTWCIAASNAVSFWNTYKLDYQEYPPVFIFCRKSGIGDYYDEDKYEVVFTKFDTDEFVNSDLDVRFTSEDQVEWRCPLQKEDAEFLGYSNRFKQRFPELAGSGINSLLRELMVSFQKDWEDKHNKTEEDRYPTFTSGNFSVIPVESLSDDVEPDDDDIVEEEDDEKLIHYEIRTEPGPVRPADVAKVLVKLSKHGFPLFLSEWERLAIKLRSSEFIHLAKWALTTPVVAKNNCQYLCDMISLPGSDFRRSGYFKKYFDSDKEFKRLVCKTALEYNPNWRYFGILKNAVSLAETDIVKPRLLIDKILKQIRQDVRGNITRLISSYHSTDNASARQMISDIIDKLPSIDSSIDFYWLYETLLSAELGTDDAITEKFIKRFTEFAIKNYYVGYDVRKGINNLPLFNEVYPNLRAVVREIIDTVLSAKLVNQPEVLESITKDNAELLKNRAPKLYNLYINRDSLAVEVTVEKTVMDRFKEAIADGWLSGSVLRNLRLVDTDEEAINIIEFLLTTDINFDKQNISCAEFFNIIVNRLLRIFKDGSWLSDRTKLGALVLRFFDNNYQEIKWLLFRRSTNEFLATELISRVLNYFVKAQKIDEIFIDMLIAACKQRIFNWKLADILAEITGLAPLLLRLYPIKELTEDEQRIIKQTSN